MTIERGLQARKAVAATLIASLLVGCATATSYPTRDNVLNAMAALPPLNTIENGRGYLHAARIKLASQRDRLLILDSGLSGGVVLGATTLALGTALNWPQRSITRAGIYSAAVLGVQSTLSLKTQALILNRGLDALNCVESHAEAAYVPVRVRDGLVAPVSVDIDNLEQALVSFKTMFPTLASLPDVANIEDDLASVKLWFSTQSAPTANINAGVKIGVNSVMQTTIDQIASALPDSAAFSRISYSFPSTTTPPPGAPPMEKKFKDSTKLRGLANPQRDQDNRPNEAERAVENLQNLYDKLIRDRNAGQAEIKRLNELSPPSPPSLPRINCTVDPVIQPLQILNLSGALTTATSSSAMATISGGTPPYQTAITASASALTPENISHSINGNIITLKPANTNLKAGNYNLVVTDATGTQKSVPVAVSPP